MRAAIFSLIFGILSTQAFAGYPPILGSEIPIDEDAVIGAVDDLSYQHTFEDEGSSCGGEVESIQLVAFVDEAIETLSSEPTMIFKVRMNVPVNWCQSEAVTNCWIHYGKGSEKTAYGYWDFNQPKLSFCDEPQLDF